MEVSPGLAMPRVVDRDRRVVEVLLAAHRQRRLRRVEEAVRDAVGEHLGRPVLGRDDLEGVVLLPLEVLEHVGVVERRQVDEGDGVAGGDEVVGEHVGVHGAAGRGDDVVLDRHGRLRVAGLDHADAHEALARQAEAVAQLVADDLGARAARIGLVADRRGAEAEHPAQLEVDGLAVLSDDAADEGEVTVGVDATRRDRDGQGVTGRDARREAARRRRLVGVLHGVGKRVDGHVDATGHGPGAQALRVGGVLEDRCLRALERLLVRDVAHDGPGGEGLAAAREDLDAGRVELERDALAHRVVVERRDRHGVTDPDRRHVVDDRRQDLLLGLRLLDDGELADGGLGAVADRVAHGAPTGRVTVERRGRLGADPPPLHDRDPQPGVARDDTLDDEDVAARAVVVGEHVGDDRRLPAQHGRVGRRDGRQVHRGVGHDVDADAAHADPGAHLGGIRDRRRAGRLARHGEDVGVEVGVERELARALDGLREAHAGLGVGRVGTGDVVAQWLELDRLADDGSQHVRLGLRRDRLAVLLTQHVEGDGRLLGAATAVVDLVLDDLVALVDLRLDGQRTGAVDPGCRRVHGRDLDRVVLGVAPVGDDTDAHGASGDDGVLRVGQLRLARTQLRRRVGLGPDDAHGDLGGGPAVLRRRAVVDGVVERERATGLLGDRDLNGLPVGGSARRDARRPRLADVTGRDGEDRALRVRVVVEDVQSRGAARTDLQVVRLRLRGRAAHLVVDEVLVLLLVLVVGLRRRDDRVPVVDLDLVAVDVPDVAGVEVVEDDEAAVDAQLHAVGAHALLHRTEVHRGGVGG